MDLLKAKICASSRSIKERKKSRGDVADINRPRKETKDRALATTLRHEKARRGAQQVKKAGAHTWSSGGRAPRSPARLSLPHVPPAFIVAWLSSPFSGARREESRARKSAPNGHSGFSHPDFYSLSRLFRKRRIRRSVVVAYAGRLYK